MKDYLIGLDESDLERLANGFIDTYRQYVHPNYVIRCHDVFIEHEGKILLVTRNNVPPAVGLLWPVGGYIKRGTLTKDSLTDRVMEECGLEIHKIAFLGTGRTFFAADPIDHGKGTDSINLVYVASAKKKLVKLDPSHKDPRWISERDFEKIRECLCPYTRDFMELAFRQSKGDTQPEIALRDYKIEEGIDFELDQLVNEPSEIIYREYHSQIVLAANYLLVMTPDGAILRDCEPMSGTIIPWPMGATVKRGYASEKSVIGLLPKGWKISNLKPCSSARLLLSEDPFDKGKGTDVLAMGYAAEMKSTPSSLPEGYCFVPRKDISNLHPYIQEILKNYK